ncbi:hypothetical protein Tco_1431062 [Tanacetum coccineum]
MMWVKWSRVLASKEKGGLGVSSFFALNRAIMFKWVLRFRNDSSSLWARVIKVIHGEEGNFGKPNKSYFSSKWIDIVRDLTKLKNYGIDLLGLIKKKVYALESNKNITVYVKLDFENLGCSLRRILRDGTENARFLELAAILNGF